MVGTDLLGEPRSAADVAAWPVLSADDLATFTADRAFPGARVVQTSGSTGQHKRIPYGPADRDRLHDRTARGLRVGGADADDTFLLLAAPPDSPHISGWMLNTGVDRLGGDRVNTSFEDVEAVLDPASETARDDTDYGDPEEVTALFGATAVARSVGNKVSNAYGDVTEVFPNVEKAFLGGEIMHPALRERVEEQWGLDYMSDMYASSEFGLIAIEAPDDTRMTPMTDDLVFELHPTPAGELETDGLTDIYDAARAETGTVLISEPDRETLPLVRYHIGDIATAEPGAVPTLALEGRDDERASFGGADLYERQTSRALSAVYGAALDDWKAIFSRPDGETTAMDCYPLGVEDAETERFLYELFDRASPVADAYGFGRDLAIDDADRTVAAALQQENERLVHHIALHPVSSVAEIEADTGYTWEDGLKDTRMVFADSY